MLKKAKSKANNAHTANTQYGMGDYYGSGIRNPVGRIRENMMETPMSSKKIGKPPKSLA